MDEFELDLKIKDLENSYDAAVEALRRARMTLHTVCASGQATPIQIESAERICGNLERKRARLRRQLEELEDQDAPSQRIQSKRSAHEPSVGGR